MVVCNERERLQCQLSWSTAITTPYGRVANLWLVTQPDLPVVSNTLAGLTVANSMKEGRRPIEWRLGPGSKHGTAEAMRQVQQINVRLWSALSPSF